MSGTVTGPRPSPGKVEWVLAAHPGFPSVAVRAIAVTVARDGGRLDLNFVVTGAIEAVDWPGGPVDGGTSEGVRADELWRHTCFEAFIRCADETRYYEVNLATSAYWAAYAFDDYRAGMSVADLRLRVADWRFGEQRAEIRASIAGPDADAGWTLNLTAIIEAKDGSKSYWALAHGDGPPDFHNRACFLATLPAPDRS